jgi:riboflavin synthase
MTISQGKRMFTGLVQSIGVIERSPQGVRLRWTAPPPGEGEAGWLPADLTLGDSVAVDGVCLTVAERLGDGFRADMSPETLGRTTLLAKAEGRGWVNLEPALRLADRLGGHLVSGHVDGLGEVKSITQVAGSWRLELQWRDRAYGRFICDKASVAVDGISLTVAGCEPGGGCFWIAVIPHTWGATTLQHLRPGSLVNLEADLLAKYTETLLVAKGAAAGASGGPQAAASMDAQWLADHGWGA